MQKYIVLERLSSNILPVFYQYSTTQVLSRKFYYPYSTTHILLGYHPYLTVDSSVNYTVYYVDKLFSRTYNAYFRRSANSQVLKMIISLIPQYQYRNVRAYHVHLHSMRNIQYIISPFSLFGKTIFIRVKLSTYRLLTTIKLRLMQVVKEFWNFLKRNSPKYYPIIPRINFKGNILIYFT